MGLLLAIKPGRPQPSEVERSSVGPGPPLATSGEGRRHKHYAETAAIVPGFHEIGEGVPQPRARGKSQGAPGDVNPDARRRKIYAEKSGSFPPRTDRARG